MNRRLVFALFVLCGSCDAFWGYTKVPILDGNCQVGGVMCKPYEACSPVTEQCERQAPQIDSASPRVLFTDGDDLVTLTGNYFPPDAEVLLDNQPVAMLNIQSAQQLSFHTKPRSTPLSFGSAPAVLTVRNGDKVTTRQDLLSWSPNTATFMAYTIPKVLNETPASSPANIQIGDINGDGKKDIVARSVGSGKFYVALGSGAGQFQTGTVTATNPTAAAGHFILMDANADSRLDLVYSAGNPNTIYYSPNMGGGTLGAQQTIKALTTGSSFFLGNADITGDGKEDLVAIDYNSNNFFVLNANATGGLLPAPTPKMGNISSSGNKLSSFGDIDKDGKVDMVTRPGGNNVTILWGNNDGTFPASKPISHSLSPYTLAITDLDADGYLDLIVNIDATGDIFIYKNNKNKDFVRTDLRALSVAAVFMMVSDINGDNRADIFTFERGRPNGAGFAFMGRGDGTFGRGIQVLSSNLPDTNDDRYGDLDNDGRMDMALIKYGDDAVYAILTTSK